MGHLDERERRAAEWFYADLVGMRRPLGRRRAPACPGRAPGEEAYAPVTTGIDAGRVFDNVVHQGTHPSVLLASEAEDEGSSWDTLALPSSVTSPQDLPRGALVIGRALGESRLACMRVLGLDIQVEQLYGADGRIRADILVLGRRGAERRPARWSAESVEAVETTEAAEGVELGEVVETAETAEHADGAEETGPVETAEVVVAAEADPLGTASAVTIEAAPGLGSERTVAPIANISPQRQMNEILDRELILFARARIMAEWIDQNFSATFDQARADSALMARLDVSKDRALRERLRPFPQGRIPEKRGQLFTAEPALEDLLSPPTDAAGLWLIFEVLHFYGVVLLPPNPKDPSGRLSDLARITRVDARLTRARFDAESAAIEQRAVQWKRDVANMGVLHHAVEAEAIPADWAAGKAGTTLKVARPVVALLRRLRERNQMWRAGTYPGHFWNDFSVDAFIIAGVNASGFWARDKMRDFFRALNAACEQDVPPGRFAWRALYNDVGLATEIDRLYGAGRVLPGIAGHGPGPDMHIHLDVRPLAVPFDATTGFRLQGSRVVLSPPAPVTAGPPATGSPAPARK